MKDYLLFIDTEASGLPKKWNQPYSKKNNWPYAVQISWLVYSKDGREIKREDHYIGNRDFEIDPSATRIHGITRSTLEKIGEDRKSVLQLLSNDLRKYQPLVIGHFLELDYHVIAADYFRSELPNAVLDLSLPVFCTMQATTAYVKNPSVKYMRLGDLYFELFNRKLENPHNAIVDAKATADCFFELLRKGDFSEELVDQQHINLTLDQTSYKRLGLVLIGLIILLLVLIIAYGFNEAHRLS